MLAAACTSSSTFAVRAPWFAWAFLSIVIAGFFMYGVISEVLRARRFNAEAERTMDAVMKSLKESTPENPVVVRFVNKLDDED